MIAIRNNNIIIIAIVIIIMIGVQMTGIISTRAK
jgi:hypothetical protein